MDVSVEVVSASSVTVSWLPPDIQFWNGIITSYTIVYQLLKQVDADDGDMETLISKMASIPKPGLPLANNPDPRVATRPLQREEALIQSLEEFYVYRFEVYMNNLIGQSNVSSSVVIETPSAGK